MPDYHQIVCENGLCNPDIKKAIQQIKYDCEAYVYYTHHTLDLLQTIPIKTQVLDIGCAYGTIDGWLKTLGWKDVIGLDINQTHYNPAFFTKYNIQFIEKDITKDDIPAGNDLIVFTETLEHLCGDIDKVFDKIYQALNPNGILLLSTPIRGQYNETLPLQLDSYIQLKTLQSEDNPLDTHYYLYSVEEITQLLKNHLFTIIYTEQYRTHQYYKAIKL